MMCCCCVVCVWCYVFLFKQKTAYEMRISDWSSDVCSSDLLFGLVRGAVLVSLAYLLVAYFYPQPEQRPGWVRDARTEPWAARGADVLRQLVPGQTLDRKSVV